MCKSVIPYSDVWKLAAAIQWHHHGVFMAVWYQIYCHQIMLLLVRVARVDFVQFLAANDYMKEAHKIKSWMPSIAQLLADSYWSLWKSSDKWVAGSYSNLEPQITCLMHYYRKESSLFCEHSKCHRKPHKHVLFMGILFLCMSRISVLTWFLWLFQCLLWWHHWKLSWAK